MTALPTDSSAAELRRLYRQHGGEKAWPILRPAFERLFGRPAEAGEAEGIVSTAWIEGRELAGWTRRPNTQQWQRADGSIVVDDDGREWAHL